MEIKEDIMSTAVKEAKRARKATGKEENFVLLEFKDLADLDRAIQNKDLGQAKKMLRRIGRVERRVEVIKRRMFDDLDKVRPLLPSAQQQKIDQRKRNIGVHSNNILKMTGESIPNLLKAKDVDWQELQKEVRVTAEKGVKPLVAELENLKKDEETAEAEAKKREKQMGNLPHNDKIGQAMNELLDKVKNHPEAEQVALKVLIDQMYQIAEQMKETRDIAHFQKLQQMMVRHWINMREMCKNHPELLKEADEWKQKFINNKKVMMELVNGIKDQITDKTQELQQAWNNFYTDIGILRGICARFIHGFSAFTKFDVFVEFNERHSETYIKKGLKDFIGSCNKATTGYALLDSGLPEININMFFAEVNAARSSMMEWAWSPQPLNVSKKGFETENVIPVEKFPELKETLMGFEQKMNNMSRIAKEIMKLFAQIKIIRDTKILEAA